jgi:hemoglobin
MSKYELQRETKERSGVSYEESLEAINLVPSIYERIGREEGFERLSQIFYDRVFADKDATWFLNIFSSSTKTEAVDNQYMFFVQTFGGPDLYRQKKGKYTRLVGRHANYSIGHQAADHWVKHMKAAVNEHEQLQNDPETRESLHKYFLYTSHYIVVASEFMRPDQVSYEMGCLLASYGKRSVYLLTSTNLLRGSAVKRWNAGRSWQGMVNKHH